MENIRNLVMGNLRPYKVVGLNFLKFTYTRDILSKNFHNFENIFKKFSRKFSKISRNFKNLQELSRNSKLLQYYHESY